MIFTRSVSAVVASACLALSACGTGQDSPFSALALSLGSSLKGGKSANATVERQLNRSVLDRIKNPFLLAELPARNTKATLAIAGQNNGHISWLGGDGVGVVFRGPFVTRTQGLGADLLTLESGGGEAALRRGAGSATRVHRYLDGENKVFARRFSCSYTTEGREVIEIVGRAYSTRRVVEKCSGEGLSFENRYWLGVGDGFTWQSEQWVSPSVGHIVTTRLVR